MLELLIIIMVKFDIVNIEVPNGSNLMLYGPPMIGKSVFVRNLFYEKVSNGFGGIYVSTKDTAEALTDWFGNFGLQDFRIIDCVSKAMIEDIADTDTIKRVSIMDLTGISVRVNGFLEEYWRSGVRSILLAFDTISTLLMYLNPQTVFRFLHVLTSRLRAAGAVGLYVVEEGMHDEKTTTTLKQLFSGVVEFREEEGKRFFRFISSTIRTDWKEFTIENEKVVVL
ncbi:MAG: recombinase RecA [Archaeoglobales archaeon]|nr:MAG: recombinase RecA [Archaeoglobales archaeon]